MASLLAEIEQQSTTRSGTCSVALVLVRMSTAEAEELRQAMAGHYQSTAIARALKARGYRIESQSVGRHRRGDCQCPR